MNSIQKHIEKVSGKSLKQIAAMCKAMPMDEYGCRESLKIAEGISVNYVSNPNYQGGRKNGYGAGCYARIHKVGMVKTVLLTY